MQTKKTQLKELNKKIVACARCALHSSCKQVVVGVGNAKAEIMFIGEAPGQKEDEIGEPFVGAAGKFLKEMLISINLKREDVYITNICKCRPPNNRDPISKEIDFCWTWLLQQINIIQPKLIVTLGRHSMEKFLPGFKISQIHGKTRRCEVDGIGEQVFYVLYHPAFALYNGSMRKMLMEDFKRIPKIIKKI